MFNPSSLFFITVCSWVPNEKSQAEELGTFMVQSIDETEQEAEYFKLDLHVKK